ncbi:MAG: PorP/SprF family type IX secretion system membrane protein [Flavobacteriaceae bacterium]|nr:PorP/SprF family type IX secretion system membrane protein [Flavobacteriaceae bacterium]
MKQKRFVWCFLILLSLFAPKTWAQEENNPYVPVEIPAQNLLKFNRFLLNPTFSTVRENKSYLNLYHRNQNVQFDNNFQTYLFSYSGRIGDRTGVGLSLYSQKIGTISNLGVMANYGYGIRLAEKTALSFGFNLLYYNSGYDANTANINTAEDPRLAGIAGNQLISLQPGFNLALGPIDIGLYAENLLEYNLKSGESLSDFADKTYTGHLQYTHKFKSNSGLFENGRLLSLARATKIGQEEDLQYGGSMVLDLPKLGWLQGGYHSYYGASAGIGFNLGKRVSLGYSMEKGLNEANKNLGLTHELNFAYSFQPRLTEDVVKNKSEDDKDAVAKNQKKFLKMDEEIAARDKEIKKLKDALHENDEVVSELIFRQDSLERSRNADMERRFAQVLKLAKKENDPNFKDKAKEIFFTPNNVKSDKEIAKNNVLKNKDVNNVASKEKQKELENKVNKANKLKKNNKNTDKYKNNNTTIASNNKTKDGVSNSARPVKSANTKAFEKAAKKQGVRSRRLTNLKGVDNGYYVVANVYKGNYYFNKFMEELKAKGLQPKYFVNPQNGMKYVYLDKYADWQDAMDAYKSKMDGAYQQDMWVMNVDNGTSSFVPKEEDAVLQKNIVSEKSNEESKKIRNFEESKKQTAASSNNRTYSKDAVRRTPLKENVRVVATDDVSAGYYIVANVFSVKRNADNFVKELNDRGLDAAYFVNPENQYRYVYLRKHDQWDKAVQSYYSKIDNQYKEDIWIMRVAPNISI